MPKREISYEEPFALLLKSLSHGGALLVARDHDGRPNAMTIGWAQLGIIWGRPVLSVLVRPSRYTYQCLEASQDFSVCVPYPDMADAVLFCGTQSGRDYDKFEECNFTAVSYPGLTSPYIEECGVCYLCRVVNYADFTAEHLAADIRRECYPSGDYHRLYFGQIVTVLADEDVEVRMQSC